MSGSYKQLNIEERRQIERWLSAKVPVREMARVLKRSKATLYRELKRNYFVDESLPKYAGYYSAAAQLKADGRRARQRKLIKHPDLAKDVAQRLKNGWTPDQIGNRMILERAPLRVCQETIYRYIYLKEVYAPSALVVPARASKSPSPAAGPQTSSAEIRPRCQHPVPPR